MKLCCDVEVTQHAMHGEPGAARLSAEKCEQPDMEMPKPMYRLCTAKPIQGS